MAEVTMARKSFARVLLALIIVLASLAVVGTVAVVISDCAVTKNADGRIFKSDEADKIGSDYDCIIILGAGVKPDGTPSDMLTDRLIAGIAMYEAGAAPKIIMSGDHGTDGYDEVGAMKAYATEHGVPSEDVFLDHAGFSTYDSIYRAKAVFGITKAVIVSQAYHLPRALYIADKLGVEAVGVDGALRTYRGQAYRDAREIIARAKDILYTYFKPIPKYLGEVIDVAQDGNVTND